MTHLLKGSFLGVLLALSLFTLSASGMGQTATAMSVSELPTSLIPVGHTAGIKLFSEGILVVGLSELETSKGAATPAKDSGLTVGDVILTANGEEIESTEHFSSIVAASGGEPLALTARRGGKTMAVTACAAVCTDGVYRMGAWVRDSLAGIGTITFYDPVNQVFGALGHGINDMDTGMLMPLDTGSIMPSTVKTVRKGEAGNPGELKGSFDLTTDTGTLYANSVCGIFGVAESLSEATLPPVPVGSPNDVHVGKAAILANVEGDTVSTYDIEIESITAPNAMTQNFIVKVTDPALLEATGGIVQGLSGSPILQDGKLIGAVTHVMVEDPQRGYGIFISNMLSTAYSVPS